MDKTAIKYFVESALLAAGQPLSVDHLQKLFDTDSVPEKSQIRQAIADLKEDYADRGITVAEVASGFRLQVENDMAERLHKLWEERPPRYSRALFETLALIAYRQPMTRGEIEEIRGVAVSTNIIRSLMERDWIRVVGHRDVPGRPAMFGTTRQFLDYFGLKKLDDLPPLVDLADWESLRVQLNLPAVDEDETAADAANEASADGEESPAQPEDEELSDTDRLLAEFDDAAELPDLELSALGKPEATDSDVDDLEPIEATQWPNSATHSSTGDADESSNELPEDADATRHRA